MAYSLGPVKPWVREAANLIGTRFQVSTIYGFAAREGTSEHPLGRALDFMVYGDSAKGNQVAAFTQSNARSLAVYYIIWQQHIWSPERSSEGWRKMEDRGSATANHYDHVHVSFNTSPAGGAVPIDYDIPGLPDQLSPFVDPFNIIPENGEGGGIGGGIDAIQSVAGWLTDTHNWFRIAMMVGGVSLLLFALYRLAGQPSIPIPTKVRKA